MSLAPIPGFVGYVQSQNGNKGLIPIQQTFTTTNPGSFTWGYNHQPSLGYGQPQQPVYGGQGLWSKIHQTAQPTTFSVLPITEKEMDIKRENIGILADTSHTTFKPLQFKDWKQKWEDHLQAEYDKNIISLYTQTQLNTTPMLQMLDQVTPYMIGGINESSSTVQDSI